MSLLDGKKGFVFGIANERSLGWAIAKACAQHGADVGLSYLNERLLRRAKPLAESINAPICAPCDVQDPDQIDAVVKDIEHDMGSLDFMVHSLAFAPREALMQNFSETTQSNFQTALEISCFSLIDIVNRSKHLFNEGASILTLSYIGSEQYVSNYNVMGPAKAALESSVRYLAAELGPKGIRVNTLSAGPVKTLAAAGIPGFKSRLAQNARRTALQRNITADDVGDAAVFLCSSMSRGVTGTCLYVDNGAHFFRAQASSLDSDVS
ncbi:MAG: enoyl-ACP reductase FabI [Bradymonadia bacterium]